MPMPLFFLLIFISSLSTTMIAGDTSGSLWGGATLTGTEYKTYNEEDHAYMQ